MSPFEKLMQEKHFRVLKLSFEFWVANIVQLILVICGSSKKSLQTLN